MIEAERSGFTPRWNERHPETVAQGEVMGGTRKVGAQQAARHDIRGAACQEAG